MVSQVGLHWLDNVQQIEIKKNNSIVNALNKTKEELDPNLAWFQQDWLLEIQLAEQEKRKAEAKQKRLDKLEEKQKCEEMTYDRIMNEANMRSNTGKEWFLFCM